MGIMMFVRLDLAGRDLSEYMIKASNRVTASYGQLRLAMWVYVT